MARDLTVEILREIRDGIRTMNHDFNLRLDKTNARLDQTNSRLNETNSRLEQTNTKLDRSIERLDRVEQGLNDLGGFMRQIALDQARHERFHVHHVDKLETDVDDLKHRVTRLEAQN